MLNILVNGWLLNAKEEGNDIIINDKLVANEDIKCNYEDVVDIAVNEYDNLVFSTMDKQYVIEVA